MRGKNGFEHREYYVDGITYIHDHDRHSADPQKRSLFHRQNIVMLLAGPIAEHRINPNAPDIEGDVDKIKSSLKALLPHVDISKSEDSDSEDHFWLLIHALVTCKDRTQVLQKLAENEVKIDSDVLEFLWPLAQEAHDLVSSRWTSIKNVSQALVERGRLGCTQLENIMLHSGQGLISAG